MARTGHALPFQTISYAIRVPVAAPPAMTRKLLKSRTEADEAEFWDTHDAASAADELLDDHETIFVRPEAGVIEVSKDIWLQLSKAAKKRRTTPTKLVRRWLREKLASRTAR